jgi:hypothetical protein
MEEPREPIVLLLQEQYSQVECYCNAQTRLHNAIQTTSSESTAKAVIALSDSLQKLRLDLQLLRMKENSRLEEHLRLSDRVIETISRNPGWHANGIPASSNNIKLNTVALATLKASIATISENLF